MIDEYSNIYNTIPTTGEEADLLIEQTSMQEDMAFLNEMEEWRTDTQEQLRQNRIDSLEKLIDSGEETLEYIDSPILRSNLKASINENMNELRDLQNGGRREEWEIPSFDSPITPSLSDLNVYTPTDTEPLTPEINESDLFQPSQDTTIDVPQDADISPAYSGSELFKDYENRNEIAPCTQNPAESFNNAASEGRTTDWDYTSVSGYSTCYADLDGDGIFETLVTLKDDQYETGYEAASFKMDTNGDGVYEREIVYTGSITAKNSNNMRDDNTFTFNNIYTRETYIDADGDGVFDVKQIDDAVETSSFEKTHGSFVNYHNTEKVLKDSNFTVKDQFLLNNETGEMESLNGIPKTADEKAALDEKQARFDEIFNQAQEPADTDAEFGTDDAIEADTAPVSDDSIFIPEGYEPGEYDTDNDGVIDTVLTAEQGEYGTEVSIVQDTDGDGEMNDRHLEALFADIDGDGIYSDQFTLIDEKGDNRFDGFYHDVIDEQGNILEHEELEVPEEINEMMTDYQVEQYDPANVDPEAVSGDPESAIEHWESQGDSQRCTIYSQKFVIEELTGVEMDVDQLAEFAKENGWFDESTGAALDDMNKLLDSYGIENELTYENDMTELESAIENGDKVIVCIDADEIWYGDNDDVFTPVDNPNHAVEVIGIDRTDPENPKVILNDSGHPDGAGEMVPFDTFKDAWDDSANLMITAR